MPPYRSRCVTYNYLCGIANETYFCWKEPVTKYTQRLKVTSRTLYVELRKLINFPLGFNSTNAPPKSYLLTLLFTINPKHPLFTDDVTKICLPQVDGGLFYVPENCRGLIKTQAKVADTHGAVAFRSGSKAILRKAQQVASILCDVEVLFKELSKIKKRIDQCPGLEITEKWTQLTNLLSHIQ